MPGMPKPQRKNELGELLVRCRAERHLSLEDVADAVGLSVMTLSNVETGAKSPRRTTRAKLDDFLRKHGYFAKKVA
jgi:transcriptional regulator with XRE-family HTH domain